MISKFKFGVLFSGVERKCLAAAGVFVSLAGICAQEVQAAVPIVAGNTIVQ